ncbi:MAG: hypothetical protein ABI395_02910 [Sphingobium sp.]
MKLTLPADDKTAESARPVERGYTAWKKAKIVSAIEQAKDRDGLIPAAQILRDFGLER